MKKLLVFLVFSAPLSAQNVSPFPVFPPPPVGQALVQDVKDPQSAGFVQYRSVLSPVWAALTPGMKLGEGALIRISDPRAQVTISFPDGGFLRMIGTGSLYLDAVSRAAYTPQLDLAAPPDTARSAYQTRVLLLSGRWFYSANPMSPSTFIVNTDVTTSVIENGSGGGYFIKGQGQMLIRTGLGRFGWRLAPEANGDTNSSRSRPIILELGQIITMDIYGGFSTEMGVVGAGDYAEYGLFPPADQPQARLIEEDGLYYYLPRVVTQNKNPLTSDQINFEGLSSLQNLEFIRKEDALAVGIAKTVTNVVLEAPPPPPALPKAIPLSLLKPINLADFEVSASRPDTLLVKKEEPKPQTPPSPAAPRVRQQVNVQAPEIKINIPKPAQDPVAAPQNFDLAAAVAGIEATPAITEPAVRRRRPVVPAARVIEAPPAAPVLPANPVPARAAPVKKNPVIYKTPDHFNQDHFTNDPAFQYRTFQAETAEDLMQGDFSRSLFY